MSDFENILQIWAYLLEAPGENKVAEIGSTDSQYITVSTDDKPQRLVFWDGTDASLSFNHPAIWRKVPTEHKELLCSTKEILTALTDGREVVGVIQGDHRVYHMDGYGQVWYKRGDKIAERPSWIPTVGIFDAPPYAIIEQG